MLIWYSLQAEWAVAQHGAAPIVAMIAKEQGALTIGVVTRPFTFEGSHRGRIAELGLDELRKNVDALIIVPNDRILSVADKDTTFKSAFTMSDEVLRQAVEGISDLITTPGIINVDFADIRSVLSNAGSALLGIGSATGENRAQDAALMAINSPLLDLSISGAKGVSATPAARTFYDEINEAAKLLRNQSTLTRVILAQSSTKTRNEIKITVIAAGFLRALQRNIFAGSAKQQPITREENREKRASTIVSWNKNQRVEVARRIRKL